MRNTVAVFKNQFNEFMSDKEQMLMFIMFPGLAFFQVRIMDLDYGVYPYQIATSIGGMFATAIMIMLLPQLIAEHRENGSLRFLVMSGVKPISYLLGIGGFFLIINMVVAGFFAWLGEFTGYALVNFIVIMLVGVICTILIGAIIGILSKNRQKALGLAMPVGFGIAFLPMFSAVLEPLQPVMDLLYVERINNMMMEVHTGNFIGDLYVVLANIAVLTIVFAVLFKMKGIKNN